MQNSKYTNVSDDELIIRLRDGEEAIMDVLMDKYKNLVRKIAQNMYILGAEPEDLIQEGMIGLFKAIRDYDLGRDASFITFASLCINRQMYKMLTASNRQKHIPLNSYISLYSRLSELDDKDQELISIIETDEDNNPEQLLIDKENAMDLEKKIENELSSLEIQVLELYMTGLTYVEIARILGRDEKSTDNALHRAKSKIKRMLVEK